MKIVYLHAVTLIARRDEHEADWSAPSQIFEIANAGGGYVGVSYLGHLGYLPGSLDSV